MDPITISIIFALLISVAMLLAGRQSRTIRQQEKKIKDQKKELAASARINQMIYDMEKKKIPCTLDQVGKCIEITCSNLPPTEQEIHMKEILKIA